MTILALIIGIIVVYAFIKAFSDKTIEEIRKQNNRR